MAETKYKQTEVGLIPEDWEVIKIGEISSSRMYGVGASAIGYDGKTKYIRITDIDDNYGRFVPNPLTSPQYYLDRHIVREDDLLVARTGASVGKTYLYDKADGRLVFAGFLMKVHIDRGSSKYIFYQTKTNFYKLWVESESARTGQPGINIKQFENFSVPLPPFIEQRAIASALTSIDNLIVSLDKQITKTQSVKQGAMQQLLTGKTRLKGFSEPWGTYKIDDLFDIGNGYTPSKANPLYWTNGTIPWFRLEDIRKNGRILNDSIQHITPLAIKSGKLFPPDSYILSTTATIGEHALITVASLANQQFSILLKKPNRKDVIDTIYFFYYLYIIGDWCRNNINAGGLNAVNIEDLKNLEFFAPSSIEEQHAIASVLTAIDDQISALEAKRKRYEMVKVGMMQQLLTGKIRLK